MVHFVPQNRAKSDRFPREARCIANGYSQRLSQEHDLRVALPPSRFERILDIYL